MNLPDVVGSGFVVDVGQRLIVTNYHVVGQDQRVAVLFPLYESSGEPITDIRKYEARATEIVVRGDVIDRDRHRDLAVIRVERLADKAAAVPLARRPAATGAVVYSVGSSGAGDNLLWRLTKGNVRGRAQRQDRVPFGILDCMILETDAPVNAGDSGGAVTSDRGELVGVVSHGSRVERQVSGNIDVEEVRAFLSRHVPR